MPLNRRDNCKIFEICRFHNHYWYFTLFFNIYATQKYRNKESFPRLNKALTMNTT
jgi:hypothetical protein